MTSKRYIIDDSIRAELACKIEWVAQTQLGQDLLQKAYTLHGKPVMFKDASLAEDRNEDHYSNEHDRHTVFLLPDSNTHIYIDQDGRAQQGGREQSIGHELTHAGQIFAKNYYTDREALTIKYDQMSQAKTYEQIYQNCLDYYQAVSQLLTKWMASEEEAITSENQILQALGKPKRHLNYLAQHDPHYPILENRTLAPSDLPPPEKEAHEMADEIWNARHPDTEIRTAPVAADRLEQAKNVTEGRTGT